MSPITLLDLAPRITEGDLAPLGSDEVCACDVYVAGAERWTRVPGGWARDRFVNVDHHAPAPEMARRISSANLAIERVTDVGPSTGVVVINHTDCDSILSAGIMSGRLEPRPEYGEAALAADHTGEPHAIADLLQSVDDERDVTLSFESLACLDTGRPLPHRATRRYDERRRARDAAERAVRDGRVQVEDGLATAVFDSALNGEFFPALLPEALVIVLCSPWPGDTGRWEVKVRLGQAAPPGITLDALPWHEFDPVQLGRWNARSNERGGGTRLPPRDYLTAVRQRWPAFVGALSRFR
jgi:hypothetical protein